MSAPSPPPLLAPDEEPRDDSLWPRGRVAYEELPPRLFDHLVARILQLSPASAFTLLLVSKQFFAATARALYEEVAMADDEGQLSRPPRNTQAGALLRHPENYARYVRKLVIGPRSIQAAHSDDGEESKSYYFSFSPFSSSRPLSAEALLRVLELLPCLETFVWASDRVPRTDLCQLLARAAPELPFLAVRPEPDTRPSTYGSLAPPSQEGPTGLLPSPGSEESAEMGSASLGPPRWDAQNLHLLPRLRELNLAHISLDGSRYLASALTSLTGLRILKLDFGFVDDLLCEAIRTTCRRLEGLTIRTSGTKLTGNGVSQVMSGCRRLKTLTLTEVEGRLSKTTWSKLRRVCPQLRSFRVAFNEVGHRHSWTCDHLHSVFEVLKLTAATDDQSTLAAFAVSRIVPTATGERELEEGFSALGLAYAGPGAPERSEACNPLIAPRALPDGALQLLEKYGGNLRQLDLTFFALSVAEVRAVLNACPKLETLTLLLDAPFSELIGMHAAFVNLHYLAELNISLLEAYSAPPQLTTRQGEAPTTPGRRRRSSAAMTELSPSSTLSTLSGSEPKTPETPSLSPSRRSSKGQSSQPASQALGSKDMHVPSAREVRKFSRGLGTLRVVRWTGRGAKGEWHLGPEGQGLRAVEFRGASEAADSLAKAMWTHDALEVDDACRRASGYEGLGTPRSDMDSEGDDSSDVSSGEASSGDESETDRAPERPAANSGRRAAKSAEREGTGARAHSSAAASPPMSHGKAPSVASSRRSFSERTSPAQTPARGGASTAGARQAPRSPSVPQLSPQTSKSSPTRAKAAPSSPASERHSVVRRTNDEVGTIIIGHGRGARGSPADESKSKGRTRTRSKRKKKAEGEVEEQGQGHGSEATKNRSPATTSGSSSPVLPTTRAGAQSSAKEKPKLVQLPSASVSASGSKASKGEGRNGGGRGASGANEKAPAPGSSAWSERRREEVKRSAASFASPAPIATTSASAAKAAAGDASGTGIWGRTAPSPSPLAGAGLPRRPDV